MSPIVRILTTDKSREAIDQGIVDAIQRGSRVLVKVDVPSPHNFSTVISGKHDEAIANWAEGFSQEHGLVWQRVGPDVLFTKLNIPKPIISKPSTSCTVIQSKET
jgi:hypothetical protein